MNRLDLNEDKKYDLWSMIPSQLHESISFPEPDDQKNIAVYLSGGMDSAIILYHLTEYAQRTGRKILTYTANFRLNHNEGIQAARVAEHFGSIHREVMIDGFYDMLPTVLHLFDRPRFNVWPYFLAQAAKRDGCKHIFIGEGSDEIFGGYDKKTYLEAWADSITYILSTYRIVHQHFDLNLNMPFLNLDWKTFLPIHHNPDKKYLRMAYTGLIPDSIINYPSQPPVFTQYLKLWEKEFAPFFGHGPKTDAEAKSKIQKVVINLWLLHQV